MRGSWRIGEVAGIGIYIHWSFLILPAIVAFSAWGSGGVAVAAHSVLFVLAVFACVALHELGHALAARRYGIETRDITLLPIGGLARLERMPKAPRQELAIALAGPAVNVAIAAAIYAGLRVAGGVAGMFSSSLLASPFLVQLMWTNVALVVFNLLPAFPMDGGRVLRALLAMRIPHLRATEIAAAIGQVVAVLLGVVGLLSSGMLVFVAMFVFLAARGEVQLARAQAYSEWMEAVSDAPSPIQIVPAELVSVETDPDHHVIHRRWRNGGLLEDFT